MGGSLWTAACRAMALLFNDSTGSSYGPQWGKLATSRHPPGHALALLRSRARGSGQRWPLGVKVPVCMEAAQLGRARSPGGWARH